jgi:hypothetical protein
MVVAAENDPRRGDDMGDDVADDDDDDDVAGSGYSSLTRLAGGSTLEEMLDRRDEDAGVEEEKDERGDGVVDVDVEWSEARVDESGGREKDDRGEERQERGDVGMEVVEEDVVEKKDDGGWMLAV